MPECGIFSVSVLAGQSFSNSLGTVCHVLQFTPWIDTVELVLPSKPRKVPGGNLFVISKLSWFSCCGVWGWLLTLKVALVRWMCKWELGNIVWFHPQFCPFHPFILSYFMHTKIYILDTFKKWWEVHLYTWFSLRNRALPIILRPSGGLFLTTSPSSSLQR